MLNYALLYVNSLHLNHLAKNTVNLIIAFSVILWLCSCNNQTKRIETNQQTKNHKTDTTKYIGLQGTWIRHNKEGFTLMEIKDTSNVMFYLFLDKKVEVETITKDRYWYYKSKAKMGYWDSTKSSIWISTDKFRFDYKLKGDTLIEFDKVGEQGKLIKVHDSN